MSVAELFGAGLMLGVLIAAVLHWREEWWEAMNRTDYQYAPLSYEDYETAVSHGTMPGYTSPMHGRANYDALIAVMQAANIDPRLPLAFAWSEGHMMSDPGLVAAVVNNPGGVKYVGAAGTTDSGIAADTGGTYAAYPDLAGYYRDWVRIMGNSIIGPDFNSGNLIGAVEHYTNGPGTGHNKVDKFLEYQQAYPPQGGNVVTPQQVIDKAQSFIGQPNSDGIDGNGQHAWAYWCEAFVEMVHQQVGLERLRYPSALSHARAMALQSGPSPLGATIFFGVDFYAPDGHVALSMGDGRCLGTLTDGTGVGYRNWNETTRGYLGWAFHPGVESDVPVVTEFFADGNPLGKIPMKHPFWSRWDYLNRQGQALPILGYPKAAEQTVKGRRVQQFERGWLGAQDAADPWDVVTLFPEEVPT